MTHITVADGKYTVVHDNGAGLHALRYGEPWRDLAGDGLVLALVQEIEDLRAAKSTKYGTPAGAYAGVHVWVGDVHYQQAVTRHELVLGTLGLHQLQGIALSAVNQTVSHARQRIEEKA